MGSDYFRSWPFKDRTPKRKPNTPMSSNIGKIVTAVAGTIIAATILGGWSRLDGHESRLVKIETTLEQKWTHQSEILKMIREDIGELKKKLEN